MFIAFDIVNSIAQGKSPASAANGSASDDEGDLFSLDFTTPTAKVAMEKPAVPAPSANSAAAVAEPVIAVIPQPTPKTGGVKPAAPPAPRIKPLAPIAKPAPLAKPPAASKPVAPPPPRRTALEEIALMHAEGKTSDAAAQLEAVLRTGKLGVDTEGGWAMLFDLLQILGRHKAFDNLATAFVKRFNRSAPAWIEPSTEMLAPELATGGTAFVALEETLAAPSLEPLKHLLQLADGNPVVRLDLSKVTHADGIGCKLLLDTLCALKKSKREYLLGGLETFVPVLSAMIAVGEQRNEEAWLLLLELHQHAMEQEAFEDLAVNYAVTFEVSPPSWDTGVAVSKPAPAETKSSDTVTEGVAFDGELLNASVASFAALQAYAKGRDTVVLRLGNLHRVDQKSCDVLLHVLMPMHGAHQRILIRGANQLIATLFNLMGIGRIATVETRRL